MAFVRNCTVAFIDVFAFGHILNTHDLERVGFVFADAIDATNRLFEPANTNVPRPAQHIFSDSIIFYSRDDTEAGCRAVINSAHLLLQMLVWRQFPARAAITFGQAYINDQRNVHVGRETFSRAYFLERAQNWIGGIVDSSVVTQFPNLFSPGSMREVIEYEIPFKGDADREGLGLDAIRYAINWREGIEPNPINGGLFDQFPNIFGNAINDKFENTRRFLMHLRPTAQTSENN